MKILQWTIDEYCSLQVLLRPKIMGRIEKNLLNIGAKNEKRQG